MRFLMTYSLLNAWLYQWLDFEKYVNDNSEKTAEDYQRAAHEDFLATLRREPIPTNEAMQKGIDFENLVVSICRGAAPVAHKWYTAANEIAQDISGAQFQVVATKEIEVSGLTFLLYGRLDCLKAGEIGDIKFSSSYEVGKFYKNPQHPTYMELVPEADHFTYYVSNGSRVWREKYTREECKPVQEFIQNFIEYLKNAELLSLYMEYWKVRS